MLRVLYKLYILKPGHYDNKILTQTAYTIRALAVWLKSPNLKRSGQV